MLDKDGFTKLIQPCTSLILFPVHDSWTGNEAIHAHDYDARVCSPYACLCHIVGIKIHVCLYCKGAIPPFLDR